MKFASGRCPNVKAVREVLGESSGENRVKRTQRRNPSVVLTMEYSTCLT